MKSLVSVVAVAALLAAPALSFAQTSQPKTRAQVRAELIELEKAGYNPAFEQLNYPVEIQAAEQRVAEMHAEQAKDATGYGPGANGSSQTGVPAQ